MNFQLSNHTIGSLISFSGAILLLPDTLLIRMVHELPDNTVTFYRYLFYGATVLLFTLISEGSRFPSHVINIGHAGIAVGVLSAVNQLLFITAIQLANVANVLVIASTSPIFAAVFSFFLLKEVIPWRTIIVAIVAIIAVVIVFRGNIQQNNADINTFLGELAAIGSAVFFGLQLVILRSNKHFAHVNMTPTNIIAGFLISIICLFISDFPVFISGYQLLFLVLQGCIILPISNTCLTYGPKYIAAAEVSLYLTIVTIFAPVIVWFGGFEEPSKETVVGGLVLILALSVNNILALRESTGNTTEGDYSVVKTTDEVSPQNPYPLQYPPISDQN